MLNHRHTHRIICFLTVLMCLFALDSRAEDSHFPTQILNHELYDGQILQKGKESQGIYIKPTAGAGPVWILYYYVGQLTDENQSGMTSFSVVPEGVKVNPNEMFVRFESGTMGKPDTTPSFALSQDPEVAQLIEREIKKKLQNVPNSSTASISQIRYQSVAQYYPKITGDTLMLLEPARIENMQPLSLELIVGQGDVPDVLKHFIQQTNGSWLQRNKTLLIIITLIAAAGIFIQRYIL